MTPAYLYSEPSVQAQRTGIEDLGFRAMLGIPVPRAICVQMGLVITAKPAYESVRSIHI